MLWLTFGADGNAVSLGDYGVLASTAAGTQVAGVVQTGTPVAMLQTGLC
ncbi:unannotated protein [freshwater metagenome]|uniref:Unannotated protein n=1 Tax=freshwater metagenome TaxID=449393 RepID=A0A6J6P3H2_9ZZZZ